MSALPTWFESIYEKIFIDVTVSVGRRLVSQRRQRFMAKGIKIKNNSFTQMLVKEYLMGRIDLTVFAILNSMDITLDQFKSFDVESLQVKANVGNSKILQMIEVQARLNN